MRTSEILILSAILISIIGLILSISINHFLGEKESVKVPCYDQKNNIIDDLTCNGEMINNELNNIVIIVSITAIMVSLSLFVTGIKFEINGD